MSAEDEAVRKSIDDEIQSVRIHVVRRLQEAGLVFGIIVLVAMASLYPEAIGLGILASYAGIYLILAVLFIARKRLSYRIQTWALMILLFVAGALALVVWGLVGMGIPIFFVLPMIATLFFGKRGGVISSIVVNGFVFAVALLTTQGILLPMVDAERYQYQPASWVNALAVVVFLASLLIAILGSINRRLQDFIMAREKHAEEMIAANRRLRAEIIKKKNAQRELMIKDVAVDSAMNAVAFADLNGDMTYANQSFVDLWRFDRRADVVGHSVLELWEDTETARKALGKLLRVGELRGELVARRHDGSTFIAQINAKRITDKNGNPLCLTAITEDITSRKEFEALLKDENAWREVMLEAGSLVSARLEFENTFGPVAQALRRVIPVDHMMVVLAEDDKAVFRVVETTCTR